MFGEVLDEFIQFGVFRRIFGWVCGWIYMDLDVLILPVLGGCCLTDCESRFFCPFKHQSLDHFWDSGRTTSDVPTPSEHHNP
jgi:hypothetical protein